MHCTDVERPKAKKPHRCMSCGEGIAVGETYVRWRCYDGGDASTNKMHPECLAMHQADADKYGDREWEYSPYSHERPTAPPHCPEGDGPCIRGCNGFECRDGWPDDPALKPDIAALTKRLAEDRGFWAEVTGDRPPTPGCHTPEGCRENGCLGWCDEHKPEGPKP